MIKKRVATKLFFCFLLCFPVMVTEIAIGRKTQKNPVGAYNDLGFPQWKFLGKMGILAGVLIGGSVLGLVHENEIMSLLGDFGLAYLMFLAGLEIDFDMLFPNGTNGKKQDKANNPQNGSKYFTCID